MGVYFPNVGERTVLGGLVYYLNNIGSYSRIRLFKNNLTIDQNTVLADFTEADFSGYAEVSRNTWTTPATDSDGNAYTQCASAVFQHNGGVTANTIYGWYLIDGNGDLVLGEKFAASKSMSTISDIITIAPKIYGRQAT